MIIYLLSLLSALPDISMSITLLKRKPASTKYLLTLDRTGPVEVFDICQFLD